MTAAATTPAAESGLTRRQQSLLLVSTWGIWVGLVLLLGVSAVLSPESFTVRDLLNLSKQASALGIVSIGQTLVILTGGIDLSVGSIITLVHVVAVGQIMGRPDMVLPVSLLCLALGTGIGALNGLGVTRGRISPFVMTLCMDFVLRGMYMIYTGGQPSGIVPDSLRELGRGRVLEVVPIATIVWISLALIFVFVLRRTTFGRHVRAIGANERAARLSGVNTDRTVLLVYTLTGFLAAVAALLITGDMGAVSLGVGGDYALGSIAAVVIGGTVFVGGIGTIQGTVAGAFTIRLLTALLQKENVSNPGKLIVQGVLILVIVALYSRRRRD